MSTLKDYDVTDVLTLAKTRDFFGNIDVILNEVTGNIEIFIDDPAVPDESIVNIRLLPVQAQALGYALLHAEEE